MTLEVSNNQVDNKQLYFFAVSDSWSCFPAMPFSLEADSLLSSLQRQTRLQALALINDCNKYKMDLTTNSVVVITDAIRFVQANKENLMSTKEEDDNKESNEPDYNEDKDQLEEKQEEETGELDKQETTSQVF